MSRYRIGIDVGGTKIEAILLGPDGQEEGRKRVNAKRGDYEATIQTITDLVNALENDLPTPAAVGIGIPGTIDRTTGLVKNANSTWLNGKPMDKDTQQALGRPVRFQNDANCFALSEATDGAGAGADVVFGVIIGTGCGGGLVVNGAVVGGANGIAGEWGHNSLPWPQPGDMPTPSCYCGLTGCIETYLSGPGLVRDHMKSTGDPLEAEDLVALAGEGDKQCLGSLARYEERLARALSAIINIVDPDVIVLGGGLSNITRFYHTVPPLLARFAMSRELTTRLVQNHHGDSSGVRGAAWLWPQMGAPS